MTGPARWFWFPKWMIQSGFVNMVSKFDAYPIPCIDKLLDRLGVAPFYSTPDLTKGRQRQIQGLTPISLEKNGLLHSVWVTPIQDPSYRVVQGPCDVSETHGQNHLTIPLLSTAMIGSDRANRVGGRPDSWGYVEACLSAQLLMEGGAGEGDW